MHAESFWRVTLPFTLGAASSRRSPRHAHNEDRYRVLDVSHPGVQAGGRGCLYAVCDGVSTTPHGREAAELACSRMDAFFEEGVFPSVDALEQILVETDWELRGLGPGAAACTLALLWLGHGAAHVLQLGDSEVYRVRHGQVTRLTPPQRGRGLGAYLGMGPAIHEALFRWEEPFFVGDLFLLITDGVSEVLAADELLESWWSVGGSPERASQAIIEEVERRAGSDDATALVVDVLALEFDPALEGAGVTDFGGSGQEGELGPARPREGAL